VAGVLGVAWLAWRDRRRPGPPDRDAPDAREALEGADTEGDDTDHKEDGGEGARDDGWHGTPEPALVPVGAPLDAPPTFAPGGPGREADPLGWDDPLDH
ncbi:MAG TPA: hypothetical protein VF954_07660, partial [Acidimicrobiales bacterium]